MAATSTHPTVFYSWQSDAPSKTNRGLIYDALVLATAALANDSEIESSPRVDHDTAGLPGSPDIGIAILAKIDAAAVFVADVSLVLEDATTHRASPNPNVLFELGYAWKALGPSRVILVVNEHFGPREALPFDLRSKRVLGYTSDPGVADRASTKRHLGSALEAALRGALSQAPSTPAKLSSLEAAIEAIRGEHRGRGRLVREAAREQIAAAARTGDELRTAIPNPHHPDTAGRVFQLLGAPAPQLGRFTELCREAVDHEDLEALDALLVSLDGALEATWYEEGHVGMIPMRHFDFVRVLSMWLLLALVASILGGKRHTMLRALLDHRFEPKRLEHGRDRDGGHPFTVFEQKVESSNHWHPNERERFLSPIGAGLRAVAIAVHEADPSAPSFLEIMGADSLLAFASYPPQNGCTRLWVPLTAAYAHDSKFRWFSEIARRKTATALLDAIGYSDLEAAREHWKKLGVAVTDRRSFPPFDAMPPEAIGSVH